MRAAEHTLHSAKAGSVSGSATSTNTVNVDLADDTPASKKLKLLADINTDQSTESQSAESPDRHHNQLITSFYLKYPSI